MRQLLLTFLTLLLTLVAICQDTKTVTKKFNNSKQISESFSVLKSDGQTKHGEYILYFMATADEYKQIEKGTLKLDRFIKQRGSYKNGKKDGEWVEYSRPNQLKTKGNYDNDKKIGIWLTSKEQGQVFEQFDYDNNKTLQPIIHINVAYPEQARENEIQGNVTLSYQINKDCSISNIMITKSLSTDCDENAINAIKRYGELLKKYGQDCEQKTETREINYKLN